MKMLNVHRKYLLATSSKLLALILSLTAAASKTNSPAKKAKDGVEIKVVKFSEFSSLYRRDKDFKDTAERFQKMENFRKTAQESLERMMAQKGSNVELELRYGELILQRSRDLEQFGMELEMVGDQKEGK